jgi:Bacteriophage tail sheath protein
VPTYLTPGVYVEEKPSGSMPLGAVGTAVAAFVGFTERYPEDDPDDPQGLKPRMVTNWSQYTQLYGGFVDGAMLPHAVYGYFNNGGGICYIVRIPHTEDERPAGQLALPAPGAVASEGDATDGVLQITSKVDQPIFVQVEPGPVDPESGEPNSFTLRVKRGTEQVESYDELTLGKGKTNVATRLADSEYVTVEVLDDKANLPAIGRYEIRPGAPEAIDVAAADFEGDENDRRGIRGLVIADEVTMIAVPDLVTACTRDGQLDLGKFKAVQTALINHCDQQANRMAILDAPPNMGPQEIKEWRSDTAMYDSMFAAMYYPWIKVNNPIGSNGNSVISVPPCGHMAGIWSRNDETRGVWKAPANEIVGGALDVERKITKLEQSLLNPIGINCIRPFGTRGIRVWGARTLSSDPSWKYVNVRRLFNMIETSIMDGTQWVVFEPNDQALWERVKRTVNAFLTGLWREGALFGASPSEAFFVKCDAETNPPDSIDLGRLVIEVGIAPVKPAEFVIFRISQWQPGAEAA